MDHELHGPVCPFCKRAFRRRRYWVKWARQRCKCGARTECVDARRGRGVYFTFTPPMKRRSQDGSTDQA